MAYQAPTLTTVITETGYDSEIPANFVKIQTALIEIQTELAVAQPGPSGATLIDWLRFALNPDGIVGPDSFPLSFSTDDSLTITHPVEGSACMIDKRLWNHYDYMPRTRDLSRCRRELLQRFCKKILAKHGQSGRAVVPAAPREV